MRKNYSSDREKRLKFVAEGREFANFLRSLEQYLFPICWKEFVLKSGKTENQELPGNLPKIGKLFVRDPNRVFEDPKPWGSNLGQIWST